MPAPPDHDPHAVAERVARESYGRLLSHLALRWRDVSAAEDALSEAFAAALATWPAAGVPQRPEAWLATVGRRKLADQMRGLAIRHRLDLEAFEAVEAVAPPDEPASDDRLRLMLVCAHPAIDASVRPALILQVVLGLDVKQMASAFLTAPDTLNKRLVRAKAKIKATRMRFEEPGPAALAERLHVLLEAIYAAYFIGSEGSLVDGDQHDTLGKDAVYLARLVATLLPHRAEALGFHALLLFSEARRAARTDARGDFVPLLEQEVSRWDGEMMRTAYELLATAAALEQPGPFQLEAAIHGAHCYRARSGEVPWREIALLYRSLVATHPTTGAIVGMAIAAARAASDPSAGLAILGELAPDVVRTYQPYWTARAHLLAEAGRLTESILAWEQALGLTTHPRLRRHLLRQLEAARDQTH